MRAHCGSEGDMRRPQQVDDEHESLAVGGVEGVVLPAVVKHDDLTLFVVLYLMKNYILIVKTRRST